MDYKPIELSTYSGYEQQLNNPIAPYFQEHPVALCDLTKQDILAFMRKVERSNHPPLNITTL